MPASRSAWTIARPVKPAPTMAIRTWRVWSQVIRQACSGGVAIARRRSTTRGRGRSESDNRSSGGRQEGQQRQGDAQVERAFLDAAAKQFLRLADAVADRVLVDAQ